MRMTIQKIAAGILAAGLLLSCGGCSSTVPESSQPTVTEAPLPPVKALSAPTSPHLLELPNLTAAPQYPEMPQCPQPEDYASDYQQYHIDQLDWYYAKQENLVDSPEDAYKLNPFLKSAMKQFLSGSGSQVCAPVNIYFALAMLAETADGTSRQQILDALGHSDMNSLRTQAEQLWRALYCNDGQTVSLMANSLWLNEACSFQEECISDLVEHHYASVFTGDPRSESLNNQLVQWLNSQTGNLLTEYTGNVQLSPDTVLALVSTAYFRAGWEDKFKKSDTEPKVFHAEDRDITTDFMYRFVETTFYYQNDDFSAIQLAMTGNHSMWLILPNEGKTPEHLLEQGDYYELISMPKFWSTPKYADVHLRMPKFDVSSDQSLIPGLQSMGITDVFSRGKADFGSITEQKVYARSAQHAARVAVDEDGALAAGYSTFVFEPLCAILGKQEIDFTLDRPFLFAITGTDNLPLFAGVVAEP